MNDEKVKTCLEVLKEALAYYAEQVREGYDYTYYVDVYKAVIDDIEEAMVG